MKSPWQAWLDGPVNAKVVSLTKRENREAHLFQSTTSLGEANHHLMNGVSEFGSGLERRGRDF